MTDSTIDTKNIVLFDGWPESNTLPMTPQDGFNGSSHHNVATMEFQLGTKCRIYNDIAASKGKEGWATMIYLQAGTENATTVVAAKAICVPIGTSDAGGYRVSNDCDTPVTAATGVGLVAVAISAMTVDYYGWYWCGGVAPADMITSGTTYVTDGTIKTHGDVAIGNFMCKGSASGAIKFAAYVNTADEVACGHAIAADA